MATGRRRATRARARAKGQGTFDDLGRPLCDVTFCVVDLETTGTSPADDRICEIGAVKVRAGETLGTFATFVNPGRGVPTPITVLTGITDALVLPAPRIDAVYPTLAEFAAGCVLVGHNVSFDLGFLDAAAERLGYQPLAGEVVDTLGLARRLVRDEVPNCRLGTLASHLRLHHRPTHRALDDALATAELLHLLLERAQGWGVTGLDDLLGLPAAGAHPMAHKLAMTDRLPRTGGVYLFRDRRGCTLYVGKAANLRSRVRSYFSTDERKKVGSLLERTDRIDFRRTSSELESATLELRLIQALNPEFNRAGLATPGVHLAARTAKGVTRLSVTQHTDGHPSLGPFRTRGSARRVQRAVELASRGNPDETALVDALVGDPRATTSALRASMQRAAASTQFELAADLRDLAAEYVSARHKAAVVTALCSVPRLFFCYEGLEFVADRGVLTGYRPLPQPGSLGLAEWVPVEAAPEPSAAVDDGPRYEQIALFARWLERHADDVTISHVRGEWTQPVWLGALAATEPAARVSRRGRSGASRRQPRDGDTRLLRRRSGQTALARGA